MRHLKHSDYRRMAWKNGKGTTTEIAVHPANAGLAGAPFEWRVSIADVPESGPF
jgi:environmental stress-induced protein Ves